MASPLRRLGTAGALALVVVPLALLAAGCGGSSNASAPPTTTTSAASGPAAGGAGSAAFAAFTSCLKAHGIATTGFGGFGRRPRGASGAGRCVRRAAALQRLGAEGRLGSAWRLLRPEPDRGAAEGVHDLSQQAPRGHRPLRRRRGGRGRGNGSDPESRVREIHPVPHQARRQARLEQQSRCVREGQRRVREAPPGSRRRTDLDQLLDQLTL